MSDTTVKERISGLLGKVFASRTFIVIVTRLAVYAKLKIIPTPQRKCTGEISDRELLIDSFVTSLLKF